jgi:hypothetical protein
MVKLSSILKEIVGAKNYWLTPDGEMIEVADHVEYVLQNYDTDFDLDEENFPINKHDGSIAEIEDVYDYAMERLKLVRVVWEKPNRLYYNYSKDIGLTRKQATELKNFSIENGLELISD